MGWTKEDTAQLARPTSMQPDPFTWDLRTRAAAHIEAMEARVAELEDLAKPRDEFVERLLKEDTRLRAVCAEVARELRDSVVRRYPRTGANVGPWLEVGESVTGEDLMALATRLDKEAKGGGV